jgi:hypothetical protein
LVLAPRLKLDVAANATEPSLFVALTDAQLKAAAAKGKSAKLVLALGKTHWLNVNQAQHWENSGETAVELLRFEFKTKPVADASAVHEHKHD